MTYPFGPDMVTYIYNTEHIVKTPGHVAAVLELGYQSEDAQMYTTEMSQFNSPLSGRDKELLTQLGISPVKHVPMYDGGEKFAHEYSVCVVAPEESSVTAVAYPFGGKAVTFEEGWVLADRVYTAHDVKGVNVTKSSHFKRYADKQDDSREPMGVETLSDLAFDIEHILKMEKDGVLTCKFLPTLAYDKFVFAGKEFKPSVALGALQRLWASNLRVNSLYEATTLTPDPSSSPDIDSLTINARNTIDVIAGRAFTFISDAKKIHSYNKKNNTQYSLGCAVHMGDDFSFNSYAKAFRKQMILNLAGMIVGGHWHGNFSAQNVSIACEVGDCDHELPDTRVEGQDIRNIYNLFRSGYFMQALISNTIGNEDKFYTSENMWRDLCEACPVLQNVSLEDFLLQDPIFGELHASEINKYERAYENLQYACNSALTKVNPKFPNTTAAQRISSLIE